MKKHYLYSLAVAAIIVLLQSCLMENPEAQMQKLADQYNNKAISNSQMLFAMGKIFREHPNNPEIRSEYFQKMIISGYASHAIHFYLNQQERNFGEEDMKLILFALQKGNHYNMAKKFTDRFSGHYKAQLLALDEVNDSLWYYNAVVKSNPDADAFKNRGKFFGRLNAVAAANLDLDKSIRLNPCNPGALFEKALFLFNTEKTNEVIELLEKCSLNLEPVKPQWFPVFYNLAKELEALKTSHLSEKEVMFRQANLYINNGFSELALRKSTGLLKADGNNNPDYLALQGFIYFKMNNKEMAMQYVSEAERISGRKSKLSGMIAQME